MRHIRWNWEMQPTMKVGLERFFFSNQLKEKTVYTHRHTNFPHLHQAQSSAVPSLAHFLAGLLVWKKTKPTTSHQVHVSTRINQPLSTLDWKPASQHFGVLPDTWRSKKPLWLSRPPYSPLPAASRCSPVATTTRYPNFPQQQQENYLTFSTAPSVEMAKQCVRQGGPVENFTPFKHASWKAPPPWVCDTQWPTCATQERGSREKKVTHILGGQGGF